MFLDSSHPIQSISCYRSVAVKHYLRAEEGIHYVDLYHLVKFLPSYALPAGIPTNKSTASLHSQDNHDHIHQSPEPDMENEEMKKEPSISTSVDINILRSDSNDNERTLTRSSVPQQVENEQHLPLPNITKSSTRGRPRNTSFLLPPSKSSTLVSPLNLTSLAVPSSAASQRTSRSNKQSIGAGMEGDPIPLLPARLPPKYHLFDLFPFSLLVKFLTKGGKELKGKKAARYRAKLKNTGRNGVITHNVPMEISLYLVSNLPFSMSSMCGNQFTRAGQTSYISANASRKSIDAPTLSQHYSEFSCIKSSYSSSDCSIHIFSSSHCPSQSINGRIDRIRKDSDHAHSFLVCILSFSLHLRYSLLTLILSDTQSISGSSPSSTVSLW